MSNKLYKVLISKDIYADVSAHVNIFGGYIGLKAEVVVLILFTSVK
ncbi:hypothetical protein [Thermoanaerobacterium aotearoense]|uniref:Uncharacterized protein n=2 Tax=Thermoanaerobacterium TaxID=28895 RepID=W9E8P1_9THEO|nr:hypothetical protein [Thermoanaerobacterium aotearoense]AFK85507.1 hypothetical protein Tsac_0481 [Thermoanaerobacterium saccharolyticum JW/SL-YS485]ETO37185.1 hypothetical protein V518_2662 [Thermoanaerobacterium aotearoense SCUT27]